MKKIFLKIYRQLVSKSILIGMRPKNFLWFLRIFIFIMFLPLIFSIKGCESLVFDQNTGVIGDTIGGITAPFINFFGAILVYLALKEQIKANDLIQKQFDIQNKLKNEELLFEKTYDILTNLILHIPTKVYH